MTQRIMEALASLSLPSLTGVQIVLLALMVPLLVALAFFSFVETTYFALTPAERLGLRRTHPKNAAAIDALLGRPRVLLVGTMLGSLLASTAYFVLSSVLAASSDSLVLSVLVAALSLAGMVLSAEVLPKLVGHADRSRSARVAAVPTSLFCTLIRPVAESIDTYILAPFGRLTHSTQGSGVVDAAELAALLAQSADEGAIDLREREALEGVMRMQRLRVRDVMTPRVDMSFVYSDAEDEELRRIATRARLTRLPVVGRDSDDVRGIVDLKRYLLASPQPSRDTCIDPPRFVPELATLEQLLEHFRRTGSKLAIAVDEYGGTAGIVALEDCVEEIVGDIAGIDERVVDAPSEVSAGVWRVSGEMGIARWSEHFGARVISPRASTVAGLVMQRLARLARVGDAVDIANIRVEVESIEGARITSVLVSLRTAEDPR